MLGFKAGAPLCWTRGRETLPLQIAQALLQTCIFSLCFFWFFWFFILFYFCVPWCLSSPCLLVHLAIHWWLFVTHYHFVVLRCLATHLTLLTFVVALMNYSSYQLLFIITLLFIIALHCLLSPYVSHHCLVLLNIVLLSPSLHCYYYHHPTICPTKY